MVEGPLNKMSLAIVVAIILQLLQSGLHYQAGLLNGQRVCHLVVSFQCGALTWQFEEASLLTSLKLMSVGGSKNLFFYQFIFIELDFEQHYNVPKI